MDKKLLFCVCLFLLAVAGCSLTQNSPVQAPASPVSAPEQAVSEAPTEVENPPQASLQEAENEIPGASSDNSSAIVQVPEIIPPPSADKCLEMAVAQYDAPFVASSLMPVNLEHGDRVIALNSLENDAYFLKFDSENLSLAKTMEKAQVSCIEPWGDGLRVGLIVRDAAAGSFSHEVHVFDASLVENTAQLWRVTVRKFQSDAGTRCAFLGNKELLVTGVRPRGDNPPYHGLFNAQQRSLYFFENTQEHTPVFVSLNKNKKNNENHILLREVVRDENNKPNWPYAVYRLESDNQTMTPLFSADFMLPLSENWLAISKTGCCEFAGKQSCLNTGDTLTDVTLLEDSGDVWMLWSARSKSWIVHLTENGEMQTIPVGANRRIMPLDHQFWVTYELDQNTPDLGKNMKIIRIDKNCFAEN